MATPESDRSGGERPGPAYHDGVQWLDEATWLQYRAAHESRVDHWITPYLRRRERATSHPVDDFVFTYYSYRPAALRRWHPGLGVGLTGEAAGSYGAVKGYLVSDGRARVDPRLVEARGGQATSIRRLLSATAARPPLLGCFGLHEWAMVYREPPTSVRHSSYPLRLGSRGTDQVVESHRITCTHFDAFRFFSQPARPRNVVQPSAATREDFEQPGCLHATMDLYRWAYTLAPLTRSEIVADCFELAFDVRQLDMRASPYDLSALGIEPIRIETAAGKAAYLAAQEDFAARGARLRLALVAVCDAITACPSAEPPERSEFHVAITTPDSDLSGVGETGGGGETGAGERTRRRP
jgi:hypothetical protein